MLIDAKKDTILIGHLVGSERITAGGSAGQHITLAALKERLIQLADRHYHLHRLLLAEQTWADVHILRDHQAPHLGYSPFQVFEGICRDCNENAGVVEILVVG